MPPTSDPLTQPGSPQTSGTDDDSRCVAWAHTATICLAESSLDFSAGRERSSRRTRGLYRVGEPSFVDTRGDPLEVTRLLEHWMEVARERASTRDRQDLFAYNVCSLSQGDYERVRELLRSVFREIRSIVAGSEPSERVALVNLQLLLLDRSVRPQGGDRKPGREGRQGQE